MMRAVARNNFDMLLFAAFAAVWQLELTGLMLHPCALKHYRGMSLPKDRPLRLCARDERRRAECAPAGFHSQGAERAGAGGRHQPAGGLRTRGRLQARHPGGEGGQGMRPPLTRAQNVLSVE